MNVMELPIKSIKPYEKNPRNNDKAVEFVANSIRQFGFKVPIVIDSNYEIVCGHTRWKAAKVIGLDTVPCVMADDLTPEQVKAFRLADNKTGEIAGWNFDLLEQEFNELDPEMFDMSDFGFFANEMQEVSDYDDEDGTEEEEEAENIYTDKISIPQYEPKGEKPDYAELCDLEKYNELIQKIDIADIPSKDKEFLKLAATRHIAFNYSKVANFYAHSDAQMQKLMEDSALVIIDVKDAIRNGFVVLTERLKSLAKLEEDCEDDVE